MSEHILLLWYIFFLGLTIGIGCIPIGIFYKKIKYNHSVVFIKKVVKVYIWMLYVIFGVNIICLTNVTSAFYIIPLFMLVYTYGIISMQIDRVSYRYYFLSLFFIVSCLTLQIFCVLNFEDIGGIAEVYKILGLLLVFFIQLGTSVTFLTFLYIKVFYISENPYILDLIEIFVSSIEDCSICLESLGDNKERGIVKTPCEHIYHKVCIERHYINSFLCPLCRQDMRGHQCF